MKRRIVIASALCLMVAIIPTIVLLHRSPMPVQMYDIMLANAKKQLWFPDGKELILTKFSHIGYVMVGKTRAAVVHMRAVTPSLSPRGQSALIFFDETGNCIGREILNGDIDTRVCEGSCVYFFGSGMNRNSPIVGEYGDDIETGNALDMSRGIDAATFVNRDFIGVYPRASGSGGTPEEAPTPEEE